MADTDVLDKPDTLAAGPASAAEVVKAPSLTPRPDIKGADQPALEDALARDRAAANDTIDQAKRSLAEHQRMAQERTPIPGAPKLQNVTPPPKFEYQDTMEVFKSPAVLLAALGSVFTRAPLTAAMKAGAAAMEGFKSGQKEVADLHMEQWKANVEYAQKQNAIEMERYKAIMENSRLSIADKAARMQAIAAANQDQMMIAATESGRLDRIWQLMHGRETANDKIVETMQRYTFQNDLIKMRAGLSPEQLAMAEPRAKAIASYLAAPITNPRQPGDQYTMALVRQINPDYDEKRFAGEKANVTAEGRTAGTVETRFGIAEKALEESIPIAKAASAAVPRTSWPTINKLILAGKTEFGDPNVKRLLIATDTAAKDYARTINPQGQTRVADIEYARKILAASDGPEVYDAALDQLNIEAGVMSRAIKRQKAESFGGATASPKSKADYDALPSGTPFTAPDGTVRTKP